MMHHSVQLVKYSVQIIVSNVYSILSIQLECKSHHQQFSLYFQLGLNNEQTILLYLVLRILNNQVFKICLLLTAFHIFTHISYINFLTKNCADYCSRWRSTYYIHKMNPICSVYIATTKMAINHQSQNIYI